jgi:hypothetical protein
MRLTTQEWLPSRRHSGHDPERATFGPKVNHVRVRLVPVRLFSPPNNSVEPWKNTPFGPRAPYRFSEGE